MQLAASAAIQHFALAWGAFACFCAAAFAVEEGWCVWLCIWHRNLAELSMNRRRQIHEALALRSHHAKSMRSSGTASGWQELSEHACANGSVCPLVQGAAVGRCTDLIERSRAATRAVLAWICKIT